MAVYSSASEAAPGPSCAVLSVCHLGRQICSPCVLSVSSRTLWMLRSFPARWHQQFSTKIEVLIQRSPGCAKFSFPLKLWGWDLGFGTDGVIEDLFVARGREIK